MGYGHPPKTQRKVKIDRDLLLHIKTNPGGQCYWGGPSPEFCMFDPGSFFVEPKLKG